MVKFGWQDASCCYHTGGGSVEACQSRTPSHRPAAPSTTSSAIWPTASSAAPPSGSADISLTSTCSTPRRPPAICPRSPAGESWTPCSDAWLADAAAGKDRSRNTLYGSDAAAYLNSMRVRIDSYNAFAEFLGLPGRRDSPPPARGFYLTPADDGTSRSSTT